MLLAPCLPLLAHTLPSAHTHAVSIGLCSPQVSHFNKIDMLGHFRMVGEDRIITVERKSDQSSEFMGELMHACYQVLPLARHNKIYTAATDFWHHALGHSSTRF